MATLKECVFLNTDSVEKCLNGSTKNCFYQQILVIALSTSDVLSIFPVIELGRWRGLGL